MFYENFCAYRWGNHIVGLVHKKDVDELGDNFPIKNFMKNEFKFKQILYPNF